MAEYDIITNCMKCKKIVPENGNSICCDDCDGWLHLKCSGLTLKTLKKLGKDNSPFQCAHSALISNVANVINLGTTHKTQFYVTLKHVKLGFIWNALISLSENMLTKSLDYILKTGIVRTVHVSPSMNFPQRSLWNSKMTIKDLKTILTMLPVIPIFQPIALSVEKISTINIWKNLSLAHHVSLLSIADAQDSPNMKCWQVSQTNSNIGIVSLVYRPYFP